MHFFLPDSQDLVDPSFDFSTEQRARTRLRQRDDLYAHEVFREPAFDGFLVSKGIVDGFGGNGSRYTLAQRQRLLRAGAEQFFRLRRQDGSRIPVMGDCGAYAYFKEEKPPYGVDEVIAFYADCGFDYGISVDHMILASDLRLDEDSEAAAPFRKRQAITLEMAEQFRDENIRVGRPFREIGVAQGWSPRSYASAVQSLQKMGYDYIAVGGMVPLKTHEILAVLQAVADVKHPKTQLHLLGVTRTDRIREFAALGVVSFDSTSPLRQAFKDDKDNYYTLDRTYVAIRIPQVEGNPGLQRRISSGRISQDAARRLERKALVAMERYAARSNKIAPTLAALLEYEQLYDPEANHGAAYRETLDARPWENCPCDLCRTIGHHVILFRGAERNRRRGLHNVWTFYRRLQRECRTDAPAPRPLRKLQPEAPIQGAET